MQKSSLRYSSLMGEIPLEMEEIEREERIIWNCLDKCNWRLEIVPLYISNCELERLAVDV
jgi:hypothetical protein